MNALLHYLKPSATETRTLYTHSFIGICRSGNIRRLREFSPGRIVVIGQDNISNLGKLIIELYKLGHIEIIDYISGLNYDLFKIIFRRMCMDGHTEIVKLLLQHTRSDSGSLNDGFWSACYYNHIEIVRLLLQDNRLTDINMGFNEACRDGRIEVVMELLQDDRLTDIDIGFSGACRDGHIEIVRLLLRGNLLTNINMGFNEACRDGRIEVVMELLQDDRLTDISNSVCLASKAGHIEIVRLIVEHCEDNINLSFIEACSIGHIETVRVLLQNGRFTNKDIITGLENACCNNNADIIILLANYITAHPELVSA